MRVIVNIDVDDLDRAVGFYTAIGMRFVRHLFDGTVVELAAGASTVHLLCKAAGSATAPGAQARRYARHWTPVHLDLCVDDLDAALAHAVAAGARLEGEVREYDWGRIATLADPFGHGICLIRLAPGGYDRAAA